MTLLIRLSGRGGTLDERNITVRDDDDTAEISEQIYNAFDDWILAPGDTITNLEI